MTDLGYSALNVFQSKLGAPSQEAAMRIAVKKFFFKRCYDEMPSPPIYLNQICKSLKIKVKKDVIPNDALLKLGNNGFEIIININCRSWRRLRFSIAHELSHLVFYYAVGNQYKINSSSEYLTLERLCNLGAKELLMPSDSFRSDLNIKIDPINNLKYLYQKYIVSFEAIFYKINDIYPKIAVHIWNKYARNGNEKSEYRIQYAYQKYSKDQSYPWLPIGCTTKHINPNVIPELVDANLFKYYNDLELRINKSSYKWSAICFPYKLLLANNSQLKLTEKLDSYSSINGSIVFILFSKQK